MRRQLCGETAQKISNLYCDGSVSVPPFSESVQSLRLFFAARQMISSMEDSKTDIKSKISFSVESLLSKPVAVVNDRLRDDSSNYSENEENRLDTSSEKLDEDDDDENITVDDEDMDADGRESLSPNSQHTVIIPQPLHPSMARIMPSGHTQWPFSWVGPNGPFRSNSPQGN